MKIKIGLYVLITNLFLVYKACAVPPIAAFTLAPQIGCALPHTSFFTDQSTAPDSWLWDFGDGNTSTIQNPVHNYATFGDYTISLTVTNTDGSDTATDEVNISIPVASFNNGNPFGYFGCGPLDVGFTDESVLNNSTASSWFWDFGDGGTSTEQSPNYTYDQPGVYTVSMTVTDANGCFDTKTSASFVQVIGPNVSFTSNPVSGDVPLDIDFTDATIFGAPIISWTWDFDDGNTSNLQNPSHTYNSAGAFSPSLTVTDIDGCSRTEINGSTSGLITAIDDQTITFNDPLDQIYAPGASFNAPATSDSGLPVTITSNNISVCTVVGNLISIVSAGNCNLTASQSGNAIYHPAMDVIQTVSITKANQTITFNDPVDQTFIAGGIFNATATSDSGLIVAMISNDTSVCTVTNFMVTIITTGVCSLTASQSGNINFNAANNVSQTVNINPADSDGVDDLIENAVPDADGAGFGDGDGNGILDSTESNVASFLTNNGTDYFTVKSSFPLSNLNVSTESLDGLTAEVRFPYDFLGFTINGLSPNETVTIEIFVPYNLFINSYWKQGNDDKWSNISTNIEHIGTSKTKITMQIIEGGNFDSDTDSTTLTDPGAAGATTYLIPTNSAWMLVVLSLVLVFLAYFYLNHKREY